MDTSESSLATKYEAVIGLEVHAQLTSASKAFCSCSTTYGAQPNVNVCPICLGHPGVLPVLNENLVAYAVRMGLATNCMIRRVSTFSRKNYYYPDLPKGYQITQYADPICHDGFVEIETDQGAKQIGITRIHMEEDSGKSIHDLDIDTLVDLNRAGVPLIEIVSEPDIRTPQEAYQYLQQMRQILIYLGICDGNLEEGSMRCDANVSVRIKGSTSFGTKREVKNLNSFRNVEKAIDFEINDQIALLEGGGQVVQQTRMWDAGAQKTKVMRSKEQAHDYRYFPEPDLGPVVVDHERLEELRRTIPELSLAKKRRFTEQYHLPAYDAAIFVDDIDVATYYEDTCGLLASPGAETYKLTSNWIMTDILRIMGERKCSVNDVGLTPRQLASIVDVIADGTISSKTAKDVFPDMLGTGRTAPELIEERGLKQVSDPSALLAMVQNVIQSNPDNVQKYRDGKTNLLGFFVGQVLKASGGTANPAMVTQLMKEALESSTVNP
ncbi:MAG: Asp-tRNA(Asn)/Glu-tRNA(Gln) amidotransferase subunit GatB [Candidatus Kapabacteria bacterium]|nr:Asp-tRNA(Asn)/Glu-tRNA(Gln) amidotransferase subunit GatB [Candidatus Kapabacteria bacterium]